MPASAATRALLAEYGRHHRHPANVVLHAAGVPLLLVSVVGLTWGLPVPAAGQAAVPWLNWALVAVAVLSAHAFRLSFALGAGVLLLLALGYAGLALAEAADVWPIWKSSTMGFAVAVSLQFIGHQLERNHPVCFRRPALALLGAPWLVSRVYERIGHPY